MDKFMEEEMNYFNQIMVGSESNERVQLYRWDVEIAYKVERREI